MAAKSSTVTVQILADNSQFKREMGETAQVTDKNTRKMGDSADGLGGKMSTFAKVAVAAVAVKALGAVTQFVGESIQAFSDLNESLNAVDVTFGASADEVKKLGEEAARNLGLSNAEFNALSVSVAGFVENIARGLGEDVPGTLDTLTTRIADFASVMNIDVDRAFEIFRSGLAGESEPFRKFNVDVSAATIKQVALAEGIIQVGEEMTEGDKVAARYLAIMEQTDKVAGDFANTSEDLANAQRIAAAEMENAKARAGEALVPFAQLTTKLQLLGAETLGIVATGFNTLFGDMTKTQGGFQVFETLTGATADSLEALVTVQQLTGDSFENLAAAMALTVEESEPLTESQKDYLEQLGYTQDEIKELDRLLAIEHVQALEDQAKAADASALELAALEEETAAAEEATADLNREIQINSELIRDAFDAQKARTDALFGLKKATADHADAQEAVNLAIQEFGDGSPEHLTALEDLAGANLDIRDAEIKLNEEGALTREEFVNQQTELGLTREQAELLADKYEDLFTPRSVTHRINFKVQPTKDNPFNIPGAQHGGHIEGPTLVGEDGPEVFVPDRGGTVIPNHKLNGNGGTPLAGGGGVTLVFPGNVYGMDDFERTVQELLVKARRRGVDI